MISQEEYLKERVEPQMDYYSKVSRQAKLVHSRTQITIIVLGLLVPVVVNLNLDTLGLTTQSYINWMATILSLSLAIISGVANFKKDGDHWINYRLTLEALKRERILFLTGSEKYLNHDHAFNLFVETIEKILTGEKDSFLKLTESAKKK